MRGLSPISGGMPGYRVLFLMPIYAYLTPQTRTRKDSLVLNEVRLERSEMTCCGRLFQTDECFSVSVREYTIMVFNQLPRSTQPGRPSTGRRNDYSLASRALLG